MMKAQIERLLTLHGDIIAQSVLVHTRGTVAARAQYDKLRAEQEKLIEEILAPRPIRPDMSVQYPPDYDGELHVQYDRMGDKYRFTFEHRQPAPQSDAWETLVTAARAIVAQAERR